MPTLPALDFNHGAYMYGPSQYLTLYPVVFFNSYETIAAVKASPAPIESLTITGRPGSSDQTPSFIEFCGRACRNEGARSVARRRISSPRLREIPDH